MSYLTFGNPVHHRGREIARKYVFRVFGFSEYRQVSNIRRTLAGNYIVDNSDVVGASPVDAAPTTSSFST